MAAVGRSTSTRPARLLLCAGLVLLATLAAPISRARAQAIEPVNGTIDWNDVHQTIDGFGASGAFGQAGVIMAMPEPDRERVLQTLFSTTDGAGLSLVRNLLPNISPAPGVYNFDRDQDQIWLMHQSRRIGGDDVRFMSTVWSPPPWMKTNGKEAGGGAVWPHYYSLFAEYLAKYAVEYKKRFGLDIYAVSPANEPDAATSYASSQWTGAQFRDFLRYLDPVWDQYGVTSKLVMPESSYWGDELAAESLNDPGFPPLPSTRERVDIVAAHGYGRDSNPADLARAEAHGKPVWQTEYSRLGFTSDDPSMSNGLLWAKRTHDFMTGPEVSVFNHWWLNTGVDNTDKTQEGLIAVHVDRTDPANLRYSYTVNKRLWTMGNWSRFVRPGWQRIGAGAGDTPVTAFRDPATGRFAAVAVNDGTTSKTIALRMNGFAASSVVPHRTSATEDLAAGAAIDTSGGILNATLAPGSVTTFVGDGTTTSPLAASVTDAKLYTGESAGVTVTVRNTGAQPVEVDVAVAAGGGLVASPDRTRLSLAPGAGSTLPVTVSAPRGGATGTFPLQAAATVVGGTGASVVGVGSGRVFDQLISFNPNTSAERPWLLNAGDSQLNGRVGDGHARFTDGNARAVYRFDLPADVTGGTVALDLQNQFLVETSTDGATWTTRLRETREIRDGRNRGVRTIDLNTARAGGRAVHLRLSDSFPADGWGAWLGHAKVDLVRAVAIGAASTSPQPTAEGSATTAAAPVHQGRAPYSCTVDHGDGTGPEAGGFVGGSCVGPLHTFGDDGVYTVTVTVVDAVGSTASSSTTHTVTDVAPAVSGPVVSADASGKRVTVSSTFADPSASDGPHTCTVDHGDPTGPVPGVVSGSTCTGSTHRYEDKRTYTVTVTVTDADGVSGSASTDYPIR